MKPTAVMCLLLFSAQGLSAQSAVFRGVKIRRHDDAKHTLVSEYGTLSFDDAARRLKFEGEHPTKMDIGYDDVHEALFEVTNHMRGGAAFFGLAPLGGEGLVVADSIATSHVESHWFYLDYQGASRSSSILMEIPAKSSLPVLDKAKGSFGSHVSISDFPETGIDIKLKYVEDRYEKFHYRVDRQNHPVPQTKPGKATIVVVCPSVAGLPAGSSDMFVLHANDDVIAVNRNGTYSFAYLDPGKYRLVSQQINANGFEMDLEAGQEYYFLQNAFNGRTTLSRNSPELVNYLLDGSYFSDWRAKSAKQASAKQGKGTSAP